MSRGFGVRVEGMQDLEASLKELSRGAARGVLRRALKAGAKPLIEAAKAGVRVDQGNLRDSIIATAKKPKGADAGKAAFAAALRGGASRGEAGAALRASRRANPADFAELFVGPGRHPQAITEEFGTFNQAAHPFMRPAWDQTQRRVLAVAVAAIRPEIDKAIRRAARRAARLAARGAG